MASEDREHDESQWAAIESVAQKTGCTDLTYKDSLAPSATACPESLRHYTSAVSMDAQPSND
jgi:hypothetical protein